MPSPSVTEALGAWGAHDRDDPFPLYAALREHGSVHPVTLADGHPAWLIVGFDDARAALNDPRLSKDMHAALARSGEVVGEGLPGPAFARHMLVVDPPDHRRLRRLVASAFSVRRVEELRPDVQAVVDALLDDIAAAGPDAEIDLVAAFAFPLPFTVICELLGVDEWDRAELGRRLGALLGPTSTPAEYAVAKRGSDAVVAMLGALVDAKRRDPDDRLVSALIRARDGEERLDERELLSTIFQLIVAGQSRNANAELFDVDRTEPRHLAFGHGIHFCLGAALARMEAELALGSLLDRFPTPASRCATTRCAGDTGTASCCGA